MVTKRLYGVDGEYLVEYEMDEDGVMMLTSVVRCETDMDAQHPE